ncbi:MAG: ELWxxDGT repeat protein [Bacteroidota bacterium]
MKITKKISLALLIINFIFIKSNLAQVPVLVKDMNPGYIGSSIYFSTKVGGILFFFANNGSGMSLWKSNGTASGTVKLKTLNPGSANDCPMKDVNGTAFFYADDGIHGYELWKSDGTAAGTVLVKDINPGSSGSLMSFFKMINVNGVLFFNAYDGVNGNELWKSDGTNAGTVLIKDIKPGSGGSNPNDWGELTNVNGEVFFGADDGSTGYEIWKSDGTTSGTVLVTDIYPGFGMGSYPGNLVNFNGTLFFEAIAASGYDDLWTSDGTAAGTQIVYEINTGLVGLSPSHLIDVNGTLFFIGLDPIHGMELWKSDGTTAGTNMVMDINPGINSSDIDGSDYINMNGTLFLTADDGNGYALWKSDGTLNGTLKVKYVNSYTFAFGNDFTIYNGLLYFDAEDSVNGQELWQSDGTTSGTFMAYDINSGGGSSMPSNLTLVNGKLFFAADDGVVGYELWALNTSTGIKENAEDKSIAVFPNPSNGSITIMDPPGVDKLLDISIVNESGQKVIEKGCSGYLQKTSVDLSKFSNGIYFIRATSVNGEIYKNKLILEKK